MAKLIKIKNSNLIVDSIMSKNMFDMNKLVLHDCTFTSNNNSFTLTGTNGYGGYDITLKGGTYTISGNITGDIDYIDIYINGNFNRHTLPYTFTLSSTSTLGLVLYSSNTYTDFQLEKGSRSTNFSAYQNLDCSGVPKVVHVKWNNSMTFTLKDSQQAIVVLNHDHVAIAWHGGGVLNFTNIFGAGINGSINGDTVTVNMGGSYFSGTAYISE